MPINSFGLAAVPEPPLTAWTLQNELGVMKGNFAANVPQPWTPGVHYAVFSATFVFSSPTDDCGSIVVVDDGHGGLMTRSCALVPPPPECAMAHPPPDPHAKLEPYTFTLAASSLAGGGSALSLTFAGGSFGPIGLFASEADAATGVIAQGAQLNHVFWLLKPTAPAASIYSMPAPGALPVLQAVPAIQLANVITIPVH